MLRRERRAPHRRPLEQADDVDQRVGQGRGERAADREAFYLFDAGEKHAAVEAAPVRAFTVIFASPYNGHYKGALKRMGHGGRLFVPCLSLQEAEQMRFKFQVSDEEFRRRWELFGGISRHLFCASEDDETIQAEEALRACNLREAIAIVEGRTKADDMSHFILHISANRETFKSTGAHFASRRVALGVACNAELQELRDLQRQSRIDTVMTRFEMLVHKTISRGGNFEARRLSDGKKEWLRLPQFSIATYRSFGEVRLNKLPNGTYAVSRKPTEAVADAVWRINGVSSILQATVRNTHPINVRGAVALVKQLGKGDTTLKVYFAVPSDKAEAFKMQRVQSISPKAEQDLTRASKDVKDTKDVKDRRTVERRLEQWVIAIQET